MPKIELTERDADMLSEILESYLSDLGLEIADTERKAMREEMKARKAFIIHLLEQLKEVRMAASPGEAAEYRPGL